MFFGTGFGVGLTVTDLSPVSPGFGPPVTCSPSLGEMLPVYARTAAGKAAELQRVQQLKASLAAYEVELVAALAADRPASLDRRPGRPGAAADDAPPGPGSPEGVSEFVAGELALTLHCARATATTLTEHARTLTGSLRAALEELAQGRLDWPGPAPWPPNSAGRCAAPTPAIIAAVEAAVLPDAGSLSVRRLQERLRAELAARDAAACDRCREQAQRSLTVRRRSLGERGQ